MLNVISEDTRVTVVNPKSSAHASLMKMIYLHTDQHVWVSTISLLMIDGETVAKLIRESEVLEKQY